MKHLVLVGLTVAALALVASSAMAEEKSNVKTMKPIIVYGNPQRPTASIEVSKVQMKLGATTPTLSRIGNIHDAASKDPF